MAITALADVELTTDSGVISVVMVDAGIQFRLVTLGGELADSSDADKLNIGGILMSTVASGKRGIILTEAAAVGATTVIDTTSSLVTGQTYYLAGSGQIQLFSDAAAAENMVRVGYALSTSQLRLRFENLGVVK